MEEDDGWVMAAVEDAAMVAEVILSFKMRDVTRPAAVLPIQWGWRFPRLRLPRCESSAAAESGKRKEGEGVTAALKNPPASHLQLPDPSVLSKIPPDTQPNDLEEVGHNRTTGFVWMKQKKCKEHRFKAIGKSISYEPEVTAFVEDRRMRRLTGVKSKEILIWVSISDISIPETDPSKIYFTTGAGLSRTFPVSAFQVESEDGEGEAKDKK